MQLMRRGPSSAGWVGLFGALAWLVGGGAALAQSSGEAGRSTGLAALDRGDVGAARTALAAAAAEAQFLLALAEQGEARKTALAQAVALSPEGSWVRAAAAGLEALGAEKPAEAAGAFRAALALRNDKRLQKLLGDALREQAMLPEALAAYGAATALDPSYGVALVAKGDLERGRNEFAAAFNAYNHALDDAGRPFAALIGRATARLYLGDREGAFADLARAAEVAQTPGERARASQAVFFAHAFARALPQGLDAAERAVAIWQEAGRADAAASSCNATARVLLETGDTAAAEEWYDRGWQIVTASTIPEAERTIWKVRHLHAGARIAAQRREFRRAQALAEEARLLMEADSANADHYRSIYPYLMGYLRLQERKYEEAISLLSQADTGQPFIQYLLGEAYSRSRDRANARIWFEKSLQSGSGLDAESAIVRPLASAWLAKNPAGS